MKEISPWNVGDVDDHTRELALNAAQKAAHEKALASLYRNMTTALSDPDARRTLGDRLDETIRIHQTLHSNPRFHDNDMSVDYNQIRKGK